MNESQKREITELLSRVDDYTREIKIAICNIQEVKNEIEQIINPKEEF